MASLSCNITSLTSRVSFNVAKKSGHVRGAHAKVRGPMRVSAYEQAMRETDRVLELTKHVHNRQELDAAFTLAGDNLVMVSWESQEECEGAFDQESCKFLSNSLARMAREADDVSFVTIEVVGDDNARRLSTEFNVHTFPTHQYYKNGELLWQHVGAGVGAEAEIAEGVLYYGGQGAKGLHTADYITEVKSRSELDQFLQSCAPPQPAALGFAEGFDVPCEKQLAILDISQEKDAPASCIHIFPAVVSLAKNTAGFTRWARLNADAGPEAAALVNELGAATLPTFVFFCNGQIVDKYSGHDRLELMNRVLNFQKANGIRMPQKAAPKRMSTAEAKEIARAARERQKQDGYGGAW